jgi:hypothetical protein
MVEKAKALVAAAAAETDTVMTDPAPAASPSKHADKRARSEKGISHLTAATTAGSPSEKRKPKAKPKDSTKEDLRTPGKETSVATTTTKEVTPEKGTVVEKSKEATQDGRSVAANTPLPKTPTKTTKENPIVLTTPGTQLEEMPDSNPTQEIEAPPTPQKRGNGIWDPDKVNPRDFSVYYDLQMEVGKSSKEEAVGKLRDIATKFFSVLQDADPTIILGNFTSADNHRALLLPEHTPKTITKLGQYFMRARPNPAGGVVYTAVRIAFNGDEINLTRNTEFELSDLNIRLFRRPLQVQETTRKGWFCGVPSGVCTVALQGILIAIMRENQIKGLTEREIRHAEPIVMSLRRQVVSNGKKNKQADGAQNRWTRKPKAIHVEFPKHQASKGTEALCKAIKSTLFESFYRGSIKVVPMFDFNISDSNKQKIGKAITRHGHLEKSTEQFEIVGLCNMDSIDKKTGITPRQMAMTFLPSATNKKIPLILSLDPKFNDYETCIATVPVKVRDEARELCVNFGPHLRRKFGDSVLQFFTTEKRRDILASVFDEATNKFLNTIDQDLDDLDTDLPEYMLDLSILQKADEQNEGGADPNLNRPAQTSGTVPPGTEAQPAQTTTGAPIVYEAAPNDDLVSNCDSMSTFQSKVKATVYKVPDATNTGGQPAAGLPAKILTDGSCFGDDMTQMTAASVISRFEERFTSNEESINSTNLMLTKILEKLYSNGGSPPADKQSDSPSTDGVSSPDLDKSKGVSGTGRVSTDPPKGD